MKKLLSILTLIFLASNAYATPYTVYNPFTGKLDYQGVDTQATDCSTVIQEGKTCWDTDNDTLYIGDGTTANAIGSAGSGTITSVGNVTSGASGNSTSNDVTFGNIQATRIGSVSAGEATFTTVYASNKIGVGTTTPTSLLDVSGNYAGSTDALIPHMKVINNATTGGYSLIKTMMGTGYVGGYPELWVESKITDESINEIRGVSNHPLAFRTNDSERMRIAAAGNVGIGTTTPSEKLTVIGDITATGDATFGSINATKIGNVTAADATFTNARSKYFEAVSSDTSARSLIYATGKNAGSQYGLIYSKPTNTTTDNIAVNQEAVTATTGTNYAIWATADGGTSGNKAIYVPSGYPSAGANNYAMHLASAAKAVITGDLGVGTTTPSEKVTVIGDITATGDATFGAIISAGDITISSTAAAAYSKALLVGTYGTISETGGGLAYITGNAIKAHSVNNQLIKTANDAAQFMRMRYDTGISFHTNVTGATSTVVDDTFNNRLLIDLNGNVGVGATSPGRKLHVVGAMTATDATFDTISSTDATFTHIGRTSAGDATFTDVKVNSIADGECVQSSNGKLVGTGGACGSASGDITQVGNVLSGAAGASTSNDVTFGNIQTTRIGSVSPGDATFTNVRIHSATPDSYSVLTVKGHASQVAYLQEWQNSAGSTLSYINSAGQGYFPALQGTGGVGTNTGGNGFYFNSSAFMISPSNGIIKFSDSADTSFNRLQFGGTTSSYPSIKRIGTGLFSRLADDSGMAPFSAGDSTFTSINSTKIGNVTAADASFTDVQTPQVSFGVGTLTSMSRATGQMIGFNTSGIPTVGAGMSEVRIVSGGSIGFSSHASNITAGGQDVGIKRATAGAMQVTDGSTGIGNFSAGDVTFNSINLAKIGNTTPADATFTTVVTTGSGLLKLSPTASAPSGPAEGWIYADSSSNELCYYTGSAWVGLVAGGSCS